MNDHGHLNADYSADYAQCEAMLREGDPDRWLACLFIPSDKRRHVHALYAFSLEIARIRDRISEPMLGEIRFQWWREALIGERASEAMAHPIAGSLLDTMARCDLPVDKFLSLIDARLFDLHDEPMPSLATLEAYAKATAASLFHLAGAIIAPQTNGAFALAADHAGIAYAMTGLMRALPWHHATGQIYLPENSLERHGVSAAEVHAGLKSPGLLAMLADLRHHAREHLRKLDALKGRVKGAGGAALLPACLCEAYLRQMERSDYDPFHSPSEVAQWRRQWILWRAARALG